MYRQLYILQHGKKIMVERGWKKRVYHPGSFSLKRCVRLFLVYNKGHYKKLHLVVSSTTGGWEDFDTQRTENKTCTCTWHVEHYPERFTIGDVDDQMTVIRRPCEQ